MLLVGLCLESTITLGMYASGANVHLPGLSTRTTEAVGGDALRVGGTIGSPNNAGAYFAFMFAVAAGVFLGRIRGALHRLALASASLPSSRSRSPCPAAPGSPASCPSSSSRSDRAGAGCHPPASSGSS